MKEIQDIGSDAKAAYAEVMERTTAPEPRSEPEREATPEPVAKDNKVEPDTKSDSGKARDATGRFASRKEKEDAAAAAAKPAGDREPAAGDDKSAKAERDAGDKSGQQPAADSKPDAKAATDTVTAGPPASWSIKSKAVWDSLPSDVKADIARRETEMASGLKALQDYKDLKPWAERATRENTTISKALDHYVKMEDVCRKDLGAGLSMICQNFGLQQAQAAGLFAALAKKFGAPITINGNLQVPANTAAAGAAPAGPLAGLDANDPLVKVLAPILEPLTKELTDVRGQLNSRKEQEHSAQATALENAIVAFAGQPENRFYNELEPTIFQLIEKGIVAQKADFKQTLREAYDLAARMNPEISEALIEQRLNAAQDQKRKDEQAAADKAKAASRSVNGSRTPGLQTAAPANPSNSRDSIEDDARRAWRMHSQAS